MVDNFVKNFFKRKRDAVALKLSGAVPLMRWCENVSGNNGAVVQWRKDLKSGTRRDGANFKKWRAQHCLYRYCVPHVRTSDQIQMETRFT